MIDKITAFFVFFIFVFIILSQVMYEINKNEVKVQEIQLKNSIKINNITYCYQILEKPEILILKVNDSFNPSINGYKLITENYICEKNFKAKTKLNYSIS